MKMIYKVWLDQGGKAFGDGPFALLKRVQHTASLHEAAGQMGMSYSKAWRLIRTMEQRLEFPLIERQVGGRSGGGSWITAEGRDWLDRYERFRKDVERSLNRVYRKHFARPLGGPETRKRLSKKHTPERGGHV